MLEGFTYRQPMSWFQATPDSPSGWHRSISDINYEFRYLTYAAADSIATARAGLSSPYSDSYVVTASWFRFSDDGGYGVRGNEKRRGPGVAGS
jgi:hypothetical protein